MLLIICAIENPEDCELMTLFYDKYHLLVYKEVRKYWNTNEDVEDVVQETYVRLIDKMDTFRTLKRQQQIHYALTTARNLSLSLLTRNGKLPTVPLENAFSFPDLETDDLENLVDKKNVAVQIRTIWNDIPIQDRMILEQKYYLEWSNDIIANSLDIQPQSVRMYLTRAKRKLLSELNKREIQWI